MINTIFYFALNQADYDRVKSTINPRTISFVPQGDGSGIIYKAGIPYSGSGDLDYSKVVNIIKLYFGSDDFEWPELPDPSDIHGGNSYTAYVDNSINNSLLEFAAGEKERVLEYINSKDAEVRALVENIFQNYQELIRHYLETGDSDFSAFTFGDPNLVEWMSILGHVTDNQDGTYSVNWSDILQTISQFQADVNQVLANPTLFGNEWYDTEKAWNLENDTVNENDNTFKGFYTDEDTLRAVKANIGDWAVLTVDDRSTVWRYGKPVEIDYDVLSSALYTYIENNYTSSGMSSTWAKVLGKVDEFDEETRTVLEWMASDIKTWAGGYWYDTNVEYDEENLDEERFKPNKRVGDIFISEGELQATHATAGDWALLTKDGKTTIWKYSNMTYADVMTAAREYADNGEDVLRLAAAGLNAIVKKDENGHYVASSTLTALVNDEVGTRLADLQLESLDDEALAALYAHIDSKVDEEISESETITNISNAIAGLTADVQRVENGAASKAELSAKADTTAVYTKEEVDGKVSTLGVAIGAASELATSAKTEFESWRDGDEEGTFGKFKAETEASIESAVTLSDMFSEFSEEELHDLKDAMSTLATSGVTTSTTIQGWVDDGDITWGGKTSAEMSSKLAGIDNSINSVNSSLSTKASKDALDGALETMASMRSDIDGVSAEVNTSVVKKSNGKIESGVSINGDLISFGSEDVPFSALNITGALIVGKIGTGELSFDKLNVTSNQLAAKLGDGSITFSKLDLGTNKIPFNNLNITGANINSTLGTGDLSFSKLSVTSADIVGKIGTAALDFTKINVTGTLLLSKIGSASISADKIDITGLSSDTTLINALNSNLAVKKLTATNGNKSVIADSSGITVNNGSIKSAVLNSDGSGSIANGAISWTSAGVVTAGDAMINAVDGKISANSLSAGSGTVVANSNGITVKNSNGNIAGNLSSTGAGSIANGQITWDASGNITGLGTQLETKLGDELVVKKLTATDGTSSVIVDKNGVVIKPDSSTTAISLNKNGSGYLAKNNISWNSSGNTTVVGTIKSGTSGLYVEINPGTIVGSITIGDQVAISGNTDTGYISLYDTSTGSCMHIDGSGFDFKENDNSTFGHNILAGSDNNSGYINVYSIDDSGDVVKSISMDTRYTSMLSILDDNGYCHLNGSGVIQTSDIRKKNIVANVNIDIQDIANAPLFKYTAKDSIKSNTQVGTSAQYWKGVLPEAVHEDDSEDKWLSLNYPTVATASAITAAREIVSLKNRIKELEDKILLLLDAANK